eukprot:288062_1
MALWYLQCCLLFLLSVYAEEVPTPVSTTIEEEQGPGTSPTPSPNDETETCTEESCESDLNANDPYYLLDHVLSPDKRDYDCDNSEQHSDEQCEYWTTTGECDRNRGFMMFACPKQCGYCHLADPKTRCQRHPQAIQAVHPGDIEKTFARIMTEFPEYSPVMLHERDPWIVLLHDVYTAEECATMIEIGGRNFRRSVDAGAMKGNDAKFEEVVSDARTSSNDWCTRGCWDNPIINGMAQKAENITRIPKENSEYFQVLRYLEGQYYIQHTDFIVGHLNLPIGPRVYTYYIYLNDVEEGGETKFNRVGENGVAVKPKRGNVVLWNNVKNENPFRIENRAHHEALPPLDGNVKYGANMWLHMYNFHQPYKISCTG